MYYPQIISAEPHEGFSILKSIYNFRSTLSKSLQSILPEPHSSLAQGIILGLRSNIPDYLKSDFAISGTTHLLAISGINLSIIAAMLVSIGTWIFGRRCYIYVWLALFLIWFYALLTGFQPPVIRAAIMASIFLLLSLIHISEPTRPY